MMHASSSMSVRDDRTGKLLLSMRFTGLPDALEYLSHAKLVCSSCGKQFGARSTITMMNRGDSRPQPAELLDLQPDNRAGLLRTADLARTAAVHA